MISNKNIFLTFFIPFLVSNICISQEISKQDSFFIYSFDKSIKKISSQQKSNLDTLYKHYLLNALEKNAYIVIEIKTLDAEKNKKNKFIGIERAMNIITYLTERYKIDRNKFLFSEMNFSQETQKSTKKSYIQLVPKECLWSIKYE